MCGLGVALLKALALKALEDALTVLDKSPQISGQLRQLVYVQKFTYKHLSMGVLNLKPILKGSFTA